MSTWEDLERLGWIKVVSPVNGRTSYQRNDGSKVSQKRHLRSDEIENGMDKILFSKVKKKLCRC